MIKMSKNNIDRKPWTEGKRRDVIIGQNNNMKVKREKRLQAISRKLQRINELAKLAISNPENVPKGHERFMKSRHRERMPVPKERLEKYSRGEGISGEIMRMKFEEKEKEIEFSVEQAARAEILLTEREGFLEPEDGETSTQFTQKEIVKNVDIFSATKHFELALKFGPYRINYTRNGRHLLMGGRKGHIAAFDWVTKKLACEINVMEELFDVQWLHNELMFAVAQKKWVYIYDNAGVELHCLKQLFNVLRLEFLPYHYLLACSSSNGFLAWLDVSIGKIVSQFPTHRGCLNIMAQNPYNAIICLGHAQGTVTMWSPSVKEPLVKMLCHNRPLQALAVNRNGTYMATSGINNCVKIWDLRQLKGPLQDYRLRGSPSHLSFSDRSLLGMSLGNIVEVYRDCCKTTADSAYLRYKATRPVADLKFCSYEDVLGIGLESGFCSMIVPGAGEPNFDALESNPYQSKRQRQEAEVKTLLEKIPPEMITWDPHAIGDVNVPTLEEKFEAKKQLMICKPPKLDYTPRKKGGRKGNVRATIAKRIVKEQAKKEYVRTVKKFAEGSKTPRTVKRNASVLDRFLPKKRK